jgi:predicted secreted hydrolase
MKRYLMSTGALVLFVALVILFLIYGIKRDSKLPQSFNTISVSDAMSADEGNYTKALEPREFIFPEDHGAHDDFKIEWWYFTGNLSDEKGNRFGYQFTIFRNALHSDSVTKQSSMSTNQLYLAHFALTDVSNGKFYYADKYSRGAANLAGASYLPLKIHVEDWTISVNEEYNGDYLMPEFKIKADAGDFAIEFDVVPLKSIVKHGINGLSAKSNTPGNASYYYSYTRMDTRGQIKIGEKDYSVSGNSWMDREWSTSALDSAQVGWDWFSLQLDNQHEIMFFMLRNRDGSFNFGKGTMIYPDGKHEYISPNDINIRATKHWTTKDGHKYPSGWTMKSDKYDFDLKIETQVTDQELKLIIRYYEGSVRLDGTHKGQKVKGYGYAELTGYTN